MPALTAAPSGERSGHRRERQRRRPASSPPTAAPVSGYPVAGPPPGPDRPLRGCDSGRSASPASAVPASRPPPAASSLRPGLRPLHGRVGGRRLRPAPAPARLAPRRPAGRRAQRRPGAPAPRAGGCPAGAPPRQPASRRTPRPRRPPVGAWPRRPAGRRPIVADEPPGERRTGRLRRSSTEPVVGGGDDPGRQGLIQARPREQARAEASCRPRQADASAAVQLYRVAARQRRSRPAGRLLRDPSLFPSPARSPRPLGAGLSRQGERPRRARWAPTGRPLMMPPGPRVVGMGSKGPSSLAWWPRLPPRAAPASP